MMSTLLWSVCVNVYVPYVMPYSSICSFTMAAASKPV